VGHRAPSAHFFPLVSFLTLSSFNSVYWRDIVPDDRLCPFLFALLEPLHPRFRMQGMSDTLFFWDSLSSVYLSPLPCIRFLPEFFPTRTLLCFSSRPPLDNHGKATKSSPPILDYSRKFILFLHILKRNVFRTEHSIFFSFKPEDLCGFSLFSLFFLNFNLRS